MQGMSKKGKWALAALMFGAALWMLTGCMDAKADDPNIHVIEQVLELQFNGPDEEFMEVMWNPANKRMVDGEEVNEAFDDYVDAAYGEYFTDSEREAFMRAFGTHYHFLTYVNGYDMRLVNVEVQQSETVENRYSFTAKVASWKKGGKEQRAEVKGVVLFSTTETGRIGKFTYGSDGGLAEQLSTP